MSIYRVILAGNPNYSEKSFNKILSKLYSNDFFKKFPKTADLFKKQAEALRNGGSACFPLAAKGLRLLRDLNEKAVSKGITPPIIIRQILVSGINSLDSPWVFRVHSMEGWSGDPVILMSTLTNGHRNVVAVRGLFSDDGKLDPLDLLNDLDLHWAVTYYKAYCRLLNELPLLDLDEDSDFFITEDGVVEGNLYEFRSIEEENL